MERIAVCAISSKNYLAHGKSLFSSVAKFNDNIDMYLLLADEIENEFSKNSEPFEIIEAKDLGITEFGIMSFMYDIIELNVALKPFLIQHLMERGYDKVIYFDVDILVFNKLDLIVDLLDNNSIVITPHISEPIADEENYNIKEQHFLKNGSYNAGFIAVAKSETTTMFLNWWAKKCTTLCFREPETGLFVDQKWLDLVPGLFKTVHILCHKGCNVSYWNLHERELTGFSVNNEVPLIFYHYSGVGIEDIDKGLISKYQNKYTLESRSDLVEIFTIFKDSVIKHGYSQSKDWLYKYGQYENGEKIGLLARRLYSLEYEKYKNPFSCGKRSFYSLLKKRNLLEVSINSIEQYRNSEKKMAILSTLLKLSLRALGPDRYRALMAYFKFVSVLRNQGFLLK